MHDIWHQFVQAAKDIDADHPAQDRWTRLVVMASTLGTLTRTRNRSQIWQQEGTEEEAKEEGQTKEERKGDAEEMESDEMVVQEVMITDGPIWSNLPFLVQDMRSAWNEAMDLSIPTTHRHDFAAAIARLAELGVRDDALSGCGLGLMCETLETPRKLTAAASKSEIEQGSPTVVQLLPAVRLWLLRLSETK